MNEITWQAPEFTKHDKPASWFAALWIIAAALVVVSIILEGYLMAVFVIIAAGVISLFAAKEPRTLTITLTPRRLMIEDKRHSLEEFESFWIFEREEEDTLSLVSTKALHPHYKIALPKEHSNEVQLLLEQLIDQEEHTESIIDILAERLRF